jgi:hypothetical protein
MKARPIDKVPIAEMLFHKVWEFDLDEGNYEPEQDETWIRPIDPWQFPVTDLGNCIVATEVTLANGQKIAAMLGCIDLASGRRTAQFICLSVDRGGKRFHLERYFGVQFDSFGPKQLAEFLELPIADVFPISYDLSDFAVGVPETLKGQILAEPAERFTFQERMRLT